MAFALTLALIPVIPAKVQAETAAFAQTDVFEYYYTKNDWGVYGYVDYSVYGTGREVAVNDNNEKLTLKFEGEHAALTEEQLKAFYFTTDSTGEVKFEGLTVTSAEHVTTTEFTDGSGKKTTLFKLSLSFDYGAYEEWYHKVFPNFTSTSVNYDTVFDHPRFQRKLYLCYPRATASGGTETVVVKNTHNTDNRYSGEVLTFSAYYYPHRYDIKNSMAKEGYYTDDGRYRERSINGYQLYPTKTRNYEGYEYEVIDLYGTKVTDFKITVTNYSRTGKEVTIRLNESNSLGSNKITLDSERIYRITLYGVVVGAFYVVNDVEGTALGKPERPSEEPTDTESTITEYKNYDYFPEGFSPLLSVGGDNSRYNFILEDYGLFDPQDGYPRVKMLRWTRACSLTISSAANDTVTAEVITALQNSNNMKLFYLSTAKEASEAIAKKLDAFTLVQYNAAAGTVNCEINTDKLNVKSCASIDWEEVYLWYPVKDASGKIVQKRSADPLGKGIYLSRPPIRWNMNSADKVTVTGYSKAEMPLDTQFKVYTPYGVECKDFEVSVSPTDQKNVIVTESADSTISQADLTAETATYYIIRRQFNPGESTVGTFYVLSGDNVSEQDGPAIWVNGKDNTKTNSYYKTYKKPMSSLIASLPSGCKYVLSVTDKGISNASEAFDAAKAKGKTSQIAKASYKSGTSMIHVTANKEPGTARVWAAAITKSGKDKKIEEAAYFDVEVGLAPKTVYATEGEMAGYASRIGSMTLDTGKSAMAYANAKDSDLSSYATFSWSCRDKDASYLKITPSESTQNAEIEVIQAPSGGKVYKAVVTMTCNQSGKKSNFSVLITNHIKDIQYDLSKWGDADTIRLASGDARSVIEETATDMTTVMDTASFEAKRCGEDGYPLCIQLPNSDFESNTTSFVFTYTVSGGSSTATTDATKIYRLGNDSGFAVTDGKVLVTANPSTQQKKLDLVIDKKSSGTNSLTFNLTARKGALTGTVGYFLIYHNEDVWELVKAGVGVLPSSEARNGGAFDQEDAEGTDGTVQYQTVTIWANASSDKGNTKVSASADAYLNTKTGKLVRGKIVWVVKDSKASSFGWNETSHRFSAAKSDKSKTASVSNGLITAKAKGTAYVYGLDTATGKIRRAVEVNVLDSPKTIRLFSQETTDQEAVDSAAVEYKTSVVPEGQTIAVYPRGVLGSKKSYTLAEPEGITYVGSAAAKYRKAGISFQSSGNAVLITVAKGTFAKLGSAKAVKVPVYITASNGRKAVWNLMVGNPVTGYDFSGADGLTVSTASGEAAVHDYDFDMTKAATAKAGAKASVSVRMLSSGNASAVTDKTKIIALGSSATNYKINANGVYVVKDKSLIKTDIKGIKCSLKNGKINVTIPKNVGDKSAYFMIFSNSFNKNGCKGYAIVKVHVAAISS